MSGAHSGGLATTVFPAASADAIRQAASMSGAFHGVMTAVTPDGAHDTCSRCPPISRSPASSRPSQSAALEADHELADILGGYFAASFVAYKRNEIERFERYVTDWEYREYAYHL